MGVLGWFIHLLFLQVVLELTILIVIVKRDFDFNQADNISYYHSLEWMNT